MPLGLLIDIKGSKKLEIVRKKKILDIMEKGKNVLSDFPKEVIPIEPAITGGDKLEIIATKWYPLTYLFHHFLRLGFPFRGGLSTGKLQIRKETVDESDGPVLWSARKALNQARGKNQQISLEFGRGTTREDKLSAFKAYLSMGVILNMTRTQREYSFAFVWNDKNITEISKEANRSKPSISTTLKRANAYILQDLLKLHSFTIKSFPPLHKGETFYQNN